VAQHIGIVACSAEGAALCYRTICIDGANTMGGHDHPPVSMHTPSLERYMECLRRDDWDGVAELMIESANKLTAIGADFLICPDNTVHQALPRVVSRTAAPWLHIAGVVADEAVRRGFKRLGILGTRWLVDGSVYPDELTERSLEYVRPSADERDELDRIILNELVCGVFKKESTEFVREIIVDMKRAGCDAAILGCTELPLIINNADAAIPVLDSTRLLASAALHRATAITPYPQKQASALVRRRDG